MDLKERLTLLSEAFQKLRQLTEQGASLPSNGGSPELEEQIQQLHSLVQRSTTQIEAQVTRVRGMQQQSPPAAPEPKKKLSTKLSFLGMLLGKESGFVQEKPPSALPPSGKPDSRRKQQSMTAELFEQDIPKDGPS